MLVCIYGRHSGSFEFGQPIVIFVRIEPRVVIRATVEYRQFWNIDIKKGAIRVGTCDMGPRYQNAG